MGLLQIKVGLAKYCYRLILERREEKRGWMRRPRQKSGPKETDSAEEGTLFRDGFTLGRMVLNFSKHCKHLKYIKNFPPPDQAGLLHAGNSPHLLPSLQ